MTDGFANVETGDVWKLTPLSQICWKNPDARRLPDQEAFYLSAGLINLINLIPVDTIYLAGDICYRYELLAQRLQREISVKALDRSKSDIRIFPATQVPNVGILAAADVVFSKFFIV